MATIAPYEIHYKTRKGQTKKAVVEDIGWRQALQKFHRETKGVLNLLFVVRTRRKGMPHESLDA